MTSLNGRVALVTGGSRGIGAAIANKLAANGASVIINYVSNSSALVAIELEKSLAHYGVKTMSIQADVSSSSEVTKMFDLIYREFCQLDILVNNAGIGTYVPFLQIEEDQWDRVMDSNIKSMFMCSQLAAKHMITRQYGRIVNVLSTGSIRVTSPVNVPYQCSKAAGNMLTQALAVELGQYNITVNAVGPSKVDTNMTHAYLMSGSNYKDEIEINPTNRITTAENIADAVGFLVSDEAKQINGHHLVIDGGLSNRGAQKNYPRRWARIIR